MEYKSLLIKDTTREEREQIVNESLGYLGGSCDGCAAGIVDMYDAYIDGKMELSEVNAAFRARYVHDEGDRPSASCMMQ